MKAPFHRGGYDELLNGRDLVFRRPVHFSSRKSSRKECFAPFHSSRYDELLNGRDLIFSRPVGFSSRKSSLGAVDGAPSTCCAKHSSVIFSIVSNVRFQARKFFERPSEGLRRPSGAFPSLPGTFSRKYIFSVFHPFS